MSKLRTLLTNATDFRFDMIKSVQDHWFHDGPSSLNVETFSNGSEWQKERAEKDIAEANVILDFIEKHARKETTISLCAKCNGLGYTTSKQMIDYHRGEYNTLEHLCSYCKGEGTIKKIKYSLSVEAMYPYEGWSGRD